MDDATLIAFLQNKRSDPATPPEDIPAYEALLTRLAPLAQTNDAGNGNPPKPPEPDE